MSVCWIDGLWQLQSGRRDEDDNFISLAEAICTDTLFSIAIGPLLSLFFHWSNVVMFSLVRLYPLVLV